MSTDDVAFLDTLAELHANDDPDDSTRRRLRTIAEQRGTAEGHLLTLWKHARGIPVDPPVLERAMEFGEALFTSAATPEGP